MNKYPILKIRTLPDNEGELKPTPHSLQIKLDGHDISHYLSSVFISLRSDQPNQATLIFPAVLLDVDIPTELRALLFEEEEQQ